MMEIIALLTTAKEMGIETGQIFSMIVIYFMLQRTVKKEFEKLIVAIKDLEKSHNQRLEIIETHVGLKK